MRKRMLIAIMSLVMVFSAPMVFANCHEGHCQKSHGGSCPKGSCAQEASCAHKGGSDCSKKSMEDFCPITAKFMKKASFLLSNEKELGLSDEQVQTIKDLKLKVKKIAISVDASMQTFELDAMAKMSAKTLDVEGLNAMIDEGMAGMATQTKEIVTAYASLKSVLTADQMAKAKEIWAAKSASTCPLKKS